MDPALPLAEAASLSVVARDGALRVRGLDFRVHAGERLVLVGPADAGEAVLRAVAGVDLPGSGSARLLGAAPASLPRSEASALLARAGWLPRRGALLANLTLRENLLLPLAFHGRGAPGDGERAEAALARFGLGLDAVPDVRPDEASLALRRRVALARAVLLDPEVLLLADPVDDLDEEDEREILAALAAWAGEGRRALLVSAQRSGVAAPLGARTLTLPVTRA